MRRKLKVISLALSCSMLFSLGGMSLCAFAENAETPDSVEEEHPGGVIPVPEEVIAEHTITYEEAMSQAAGTRDALPIKVDLSNTNFFPPIENQGHIGSCMAFATTYYQFTYEAARLKGVNAKTYAANRYSPKWSYNFANSGENDKTSYYTIYEILKHHGAVKWDQFLYNGDKTVATNYRSWCMNKNYMREALKTRLDAWYIIRIPIGTTSPTITNPNDNDLNFVKSMLNLGYVLVTTSNFNIDDYVVNSNYGKIIIANKENNDGHALTIVGYDDTVSYDLNGNGTIEFFEKGAFKIANSWGDGWENSGYCWVMYDALNQVSNASNLNFDGRKAIFCMSTSIGYNDFTYIILKEYNPILLAEVSFRQKARNTTKNIAFSNNQSASEENDFDILTAFKSLGGKYKFDGTAPTISQLGTFVFDLGTNDNNFPTTQERNKYINMFLKTGDFESVYINSAKIIDDEGNVVSQGASATIPANSSYSTNNIGKTTLGDVNYDGILDATDIALIRSFIAGNQSFSDLKIKLSDVNKDGVVNITDVTLLRSLITQ